ncbi:MAG: oligosaccharide flippase family protein [Bacteroidales bacterium]|jgi:O-antigen/teichoic acid export membrane protein|nr:oligosaccharide flippase family protein [Bacteroidales bacterium]
MSDIKKLASQTAIYGIPTIVGRFLNYFLVFLHTYFLATDSYGIVGSLYAYVSFLMIVLTYGMETAFFRFSQTAKDKNIVYNTALLSLITTSCAFLVITFCFLSPITNVMNGEANMFYEKKYIAIFLIIIAFDALRAIPYAKLRVEQKAKRFALIKSIDIFSNIAFNLLFFFVIKPQDLVMAIFLSNCFASAISFFLLMPEYCQFRFRFSFALWKRMIAYGLPIMIGGLAGMINETFDRIALQHLITVPKGVADSSKYILSQIGVYSACYKLSIVMTLFIQAFKFAAEPFFFSKMKDKDAKSVYVRIMTAYTLFLIVIFLGVIAYLDVFKLFLREEYHQGMKVVPLLLIANLCLGVYYNLSVWYKVSDKTIYGAYISFIGAIITLVLNYLLVPILGYIGAAWTTLACYFTIMVVCYLFGQKFYPIAYPIKRLAAYLLLAIGLYFVMAYLPITDLAWRLVANTIILFAFVGLVFKLDIYKLIKQ